MNLCWKSCRVAAVALAAVFAVSSIQGVAQMGGMDMGPAKGGDAALPSPPAKADVDVAGGTIHIDYNTPHMRGRKIMGGLVPYGQVWRTGANPATTVITSVPLKFGGLLVPAGTHTLYSLPSAGAWQLILNNQTGQWGTVYQQSMDLGRVPMKSKPMAAPQEFMSLTFEHTTPTSTELHIKWETTDEYVVVSKP